MLSKIAEGIGVKLSLSARQVRSLNSGNGATFIDLTAQLIELGLGIWQEMEISEAKRAVMAEFYKIGQELKQKVEDHLQEVEKEIFDQTADKVEYAQNAYQKANSTNDATYKALIELRDELNALLKADLKR